MIKKIIISEILLIMFIIFILNNWKNLNNERSWGSGAGIATSQSGRTDEITPVAKPVSPALAKVETITATITGFNTVPEQTDDKPCLSSSEDWICGRTDVAACPPDIPFGVWIEIAGQQYECLDRTNDQAPNHYDLSFDKDISAALNFGRQTKVVKIIK